MPKLKPAVSFPPSYDQSEVPTQRGDGSQACSCFGMRQLLYTAAASTKPRGEEEAAQGRAHEGLP